MKQRIGVLAAIATYLLYGGSLVFVKNVTATIDPFTLLGWRFVVALVTLLVLMAVRVIKVRLTRAALRPLLLLAVFQPVVYYTAETLGVIRTTASETGLILAAVPVGMLLASLLILRHKPTRWQLIGIAVALAGVIVTVVAKGLAADFNPLGYALLVVAVIAYALYTAFADRYATAATDMDKTFVMVAAGTLVFGTIAVGEHAADGTLGTLAALPFANGAFAVAVAYLALGCTVGAFFLQNVAIGALGTTRFSTFVGLATVTTLATSAIFLRETLSPAQYIGGVIIIAGVYVANWRARVRTPTVSPGD